MIGPAALFALAALAIAVALLIPNAWALVPVSLGTAAALVAAFWRTRGDGREKPRIPEAVLGAGCAVGLGCTLFTNPTLYGDARAFQSGFRWVALTALVVLATYLGVHLHASLIRARFLILLACYAVLAVVVIRASPKPWIDVWVFRQAAADALLRGFSPYSVSYPDIYGPRVPWAYPPQLLHGGRVVAFPYLPLTVLLDAPAFALLGDVRYTLVALTIAAAWLFARAVPGSLGELAALLVLFHPRTLFVLEQAFTEPLVIFCFALTIHAIARREHWAMAGAALGLLAASKQYSPYLVVPLAFALPRRALLVAAAVVITVLGPFVMSDPAGFWRGTVGFLVHAPFRTDSLSLSALAVRLFGAGAQPFAVAGMLVGAVVLALCIRRNPGLPMACAAAAASFAVVLIWSKQSFANYWWLCSGLLAMAGALRVSGAVPPPDVSVPANSITTDRGSARYLSPETKGARSQSTISCGESRKVSIHRRHAFPPPPAAGGSSNSSGSQYALRMM